MLSLFVGLSSAQSALLGEANKPRTGRGAAGNLLDDESERLEDAIQEIVTEASSRQPLGQDEVEIRAEILVRHAMATSDWEAAARAATEVIRRQR